MTDRLEAAIAELVVALREEVAAETAASRPTNGAQALYSIKEAAGRLGVSRTAVYSELAAGRLRSLKIGRRRLIPSDAIAELVASR